MAHVNLEINDETYTLEYTRDALVKMEKIGFSLTQAEDKIISSLEIMFWGGLLKNHKNMTLQRSNKLLDEVFKDYDSTTLFPCLLELINDVFDFDNGSTEKKKVMIVK